MPSTECTATTSTHFIPHFSASSTVKTQILSTAPLGSGLDLYEEFEKYDTRPTLGPVLSVPEVDDIEATTDFLDIPMDGLKEINELNNYLSQPIEKVTDPIKWWWDHRKVFPKLSGMAFDFLSVPGTFYLMFLFKFSLIMFISDIYCR